MRSFAFSRRDQFTRGFGAVCLWLGVGVLLLTVGFLFEQSGGWTSLGSRLRLCFFGEWRPLATPPTLGLAHAWASTLIVNGIALALAAPLGIAIGMFVSTIAPRPLQAILTPALELLAGIPAVVFGFFGAVTIVPFMEAWFDLPTGETLLGAGVVLSMMMLPFIASTSGEALRAVVDEYRESVVSLGVDTLYMFRRVVVVRAMPGLVAATALGLARGLGETLAVLMLSGNSSAFPESVLSRGQPLTALLATEIGETATDSDKYRMLFTGALALMLGVVLINLLVSWLKKSLLQGAHAT